VLGTKRVPIDVQQVRKETGKNKMGGTFSFGLVKSQSKTIVSKVMKRGLKGSNWGKGKKVVYKTRGRPALEEWLKSIGDLDRT